MSCLPSLRARDYLLSLHPHDNRAIRLLSSRLNLSIRDTVHLIVTDYLSHHDIDLDDIFSHPKLLLDND